MGIYSRNRPEWDITNWALMYFSGTIVTLYNTLGEESLSYALDHTQLTICSCDGSSLKKLLTLKSDGKAKNLKAVVVFDPVSEEDEKAFSELEVNLYHYQNLVEKGSQLDDKLLDDMSKPTPDTIDVICFTSGTTGVPKGAMVSHSNHT